MKTPNRVATSQLAKGHGDVDDYFDSIASVPKARAAWNRISIGGLDAGPMTARENAHNHAMASRGLVRDALVGDCASIAEIYNEGIAEGRSTFETEARSATYVNEWLGSPVGRA